VGNIWGNSYICIMASIKFIVKSDSETASIYLRFKEGRLIDVTVKTNFIVNSKDWSTKNNGQPKNLKDESLKKLDTDLKGLSTNLLKHYNDTLNKLEINSQWLKDFINPPQKIIKASNKLISFIDYYNDIKAKDIKSGTLKRNKATRNLIYKFQTESKSIFLIKDIDSNFTLKFEQYCLGKRYSINYIARAVTFLKTICFNARLNDIEISSKVDLIKTTKAEKVEKIYLTIDELTIIENITFDTESLNNAKDWLLISCETGQRVSDFMNFTKDKIRLENKKALIEFTQVKTNKKMTVPLSKRVISILKKRGGNFPYAISDQRYNEYIKDVCRIAKINQKIKGSKAITKDKITRKESGTFEKWELVSSHIGRRSFATNNYGKIPTSLLIGATGHSTEQMFLEYIGKTDTQKALQLAEYF
jgi:integrase